MKYCVLARQSFYDRALVTILMTVLSCLGHIFGDKKPILRDEKVLS
jgi:hypothetical protein